MAKYKSDFLNVLDERGFVELESRCCAFLDFEIRVESGGDRIALELSGPEGTKEMLRPLIERRGEKE